MYVRLTLCLTFIYFILSSVPIGMTQTTLRLQTMQTIRKQRKRQNQQLQGSLDLDDRDEHVPH